MRSIVGLALACATLSGCSCDGITGSGADDGGPPPPDGAATCTSNAECQGGLCVDGRCCPLTNQVCGDVCCGAAEVCFATQCVTPGAECHSARDCPDGQYCEISLGDNEFPPDAGTLPPGCFAPRPPLGRCLSLLPRCPDGDGGVAAPDAGPCLAPCEYRPPAGTLNARVKWHWGPTATEYPTYTDVWSTPAVGRLHDSNCDDEIDELDAPSVVFVAGELLANCCHCTGQTPSRCTTGVLRALDGLTGQEIWSLPKASPTSVGFTGISVALGDLNGDGRLEVAAVTGEGYVVIVDGDGAVLATSDQPIPSCSAAGCAATMLGWGGALAIGDMNGDGAPEVVHGATVFTTAGGGLRWVFTGARAWGGNQAWDTALSTLADVDGDGQLELVTGKTTYKVDGTVLWDRPADEATLPDGYPAVADLDQDGQPEVLLVSSGKLYVFDGQTGAPKLGSPVAIGAAADGFGGPPTVADFDGDGWPEVGVARANHYTVLKPQPAGGAIAILWQAPNHDLSSSVTGSTVFDFEGDGAAEVIYNDECFLWVYDGRNGSVRFATPHTSFTGTETSLVADVDGDGHAEIVMISNGADPSAAGWSCDVAPWNQPDATNGRPAWVAPPYGPAYKGLTVFGDAANSWVGTRTLWNQHTYHVSNVCDPSDDACAAGSPYGAIPAHERPNWSVPWLNNFRQNVQQAGIFKAPDATVLLEAECSTPVTLHAYVRNLGMALLPAGVTVGFFVRATGDTLLATKTTQTALWPGQVEEVTYAAQPADGVGADDRFVARIVVDPQQPLFHECRADNDESPVAVVRCLD